MSKSRASVKITRVKTVTKTITRTRKSSKSSGQKRCPSCGRYL